MAITASGKWSKPANSPTTSVDSKDYFSGVLTTTATYQDPNKHIFGFLAGEIHIFNTGGQDLVYQWPRLDGEAKDSGIVKAGTSVVFRRTNQPGINVRHDTSATTYHITAV